MGSTSRTLEITVLSCEDLRIDRRLVKKNTYVMVRTDPLNYRTTKMDTEGGAYPSWNQKLTIDMPLHERFITLRDAKGERNGIVNVSVKVKVPEYYLSSNNNKKVVPENNSFSMTSKPVPAIPIGSGKNFGIVIGIPVLGVNQV
ncbi:hypothetical protein GH714_019780 [Hevea brasiliensis]|uniref:C2 domain-containing protein n=1 Tax=Hevea brasiliensis TaxID=3981 RepID=A0A6A6MG10_HEVBR|nr:hypothetical protein GH714_019780 [Hevea brasiliensis]